MNRAAPIEVRFWEKVYKTDSCWFWIGAKNPRGYGCIEMNGKPLNTHKVSWILHNGPVPDNLHVLHKCDITQCVNPAHLFLGTRSQNIQDAKAKGIAFQWRKSVCRRGHDMNVFEAFRPDGGRFCRACNALHCRKYKQKRREARLVS